jgi:heme exporter protein CcmB
MVFIIPKDLVSQQAPALLFMILPIAQISNTNAIFQQDYRDGTLEFKLVSTSADHIAVTKFLALNIISFAVIILIMPLFSLLYSLDLYSTIKFGFIYCLMIFYVNAFTVLISAIQVYFGSACNFIATLIFPLIIPGIICGVLSIFEVQTYIIYLKLLLGLNLILIPLIIIMVSYLIRNIYNI